MTARRGPVGGGWLGAAAVAGALAGCVGSISERRDGLDASAVPSEERADYAVFAQRCSKCHSLARPLYSGITDDEFWHEYVEKMRLQPGSGISQGDTQPILRFLHWYSALKSHPRAEGPVVR